MEHDFIDKYSRVESFLSRLDPRIKVVSLLAFTVCLVSTEPTAYRAFAVYGFILAVLTVLSRIPILDILKRMLVAAPFILMTVLFIPFMKGETIVHAFILGPLTVTISREGLVLFMNVFAKASLALLCAVLMTATTGFPELLKALEKLKCPQVFIMILSFMYRYIFVVQDEFMMMRQAKESRSIGGSRWFHARALAGMIGVLFIRSYERAEGVYLAMCARGFSGRIRTIHDFHVAAKDVAFLAMILASLIGARFLSGMNG
jgi:cobalt/nickel transport system permease protein